MTSTTPVPQSMVGRLVLGRYRVLRHLADGGMGAIYLARSEGAAGFVRPVVVKFLLPGLLGDERMVQMFVREAHIMSNLRHPSIVSVIDFAQEGDMYVMVLDYVHGFHLGRWYRYVRDTRGQFPIEPALYIMQQVMRALHYAHTTKGAGGELLGVVHRDVTPSNILIDVEGHTKLADFGIARTSAEHTDIERRAIKGKFPYLAPELLDGTEPDASTDVYSAAVTLHEVLVGRNEFGATTMEAIVARVLKHTPIRVDRARSDASAALADVVERALSKDPGERYRTAAELAEALGAVRGVSEEQAAATVAELAGRDFRDRNMAAFLTLPDLSVLEASWKTPTPTAEPRTEPEVGVPPALAAERALGLAETAAGIDTGEAGSWEDSGSQRRKRPTDGATIAASPGARAGTGVRRTGPGREPAAPAAEPAGSAAARRERGPWLVVAGLAVVAVAGAGVAIALAMRGGGERDPAYIVVQDRKGAPAPAATPAATRATEVPAASPDAAPVARDPGAVIRPVTTADRLTRAFNAQRGKIRQCFADHAAQLEGNPEISVRLEVDRKGAVTAAELSPAALNDTELGGCLLGVARATRFGTLPEPVAFRVPIRARVK